MIDVCISFTKKYDIDIRCQKCMDSTDTFEHLESCNLDTYINMETRNGSNCSNGSSQIKKNNYECHFG